jgi:hypothetical protein
VRVLNQRFGPQSGVFIGRGSPWGNPFHIDEEHGREWVIRRYRAYAIERLQREPAWLEPLRGAGALVCFCAPLPCHGDVLVELLDATGDQ